MMNNKQLLQCRIIAAYNGSQKVVDAIDEEIRYRIHEEKWAGIIRD